MAKTINNSKELYTKLLTDQGIVPVYRTFSLATRRNPTDRWALFYDSLYLEKIDPVFVKITYSPTLSFQKGQPTDFSKYFIGATEVYRSEIYTASGRPINLLTSDLNPEPFLDENKSYLLCSEYSATLAKVNSVKEPITFGEIDEYIALDYVKGVRDLKTYTVIEAKGKTSIYSYVEVYFKSTSLPSATFAIGEKAATLNEIYDKGATASYSFMANVLAAKTGGKLV